MHRETVVLSKRPYLKEISNSSTPSEAEQAGRLRRGHAHLQRLGNRQAGEGRKRDRAGQLELERRDLGKVFVKAGRVPGLDFLNQKISLR